MEDKNMSRYKIWSFYKEADILNGGCFVIPRMISVWLSQVCNLRCGHCLFTEANKEVNGFIDADKFKNFIDDVTNLGVKSIEYSGGGEPLLHKECYNLADYIVDKGMSIGVLTNGIDIDVNRVIDVFSYIRISLDAVDKEQYEKIKNPIQKDSFKQVIDNIRLLIDRRGSSKRPVVGIKFLVGLDNMDSISKMVSLAKKLEVDYIQFKPLHTSDSILNNDQIETVTKKINFWKLVTDFPILGGVERKLGTVKCFMSPIHTVVDSMGNLLVCCYFNKPAYWIGNVFETKFIYLWGGDKHRKLVDEITLDMCNKFDCRWHRYNSEMKDILDKGKYDLEFI